MVVTIFPPVYSLQKLEIMTLATDHVFYLQQDFSLADGVNSPTFAPVFITFL